MILSVILPVIVILIVIVFLNCPIYIGILAAAVYLQVFINNMPLQNLFIGLFESLAKNSLLAVPFFIFAGTLIADSTLGNRLINFFIASLRNVKGGLPIACLVANAFFGAISGSASAATATFSRIAYEPLEEYHGEKLSLGIITSSASLSSVIPPSITMIIFGVATETSIAKLFMAGFLPGILVVIIVGVYLIIRTSKTQAYSKDEIKVGGVKQTLIKGLPVLVLPIIVLGSVYGGITTPTETGAIAAIYTLVVSVFVLRDLNLRKLFDCAKSTAKITAQVFLLVATSSVFAQAATITQLPTYILDSFVGLNTWQFLILLNILLLIIGFFFDPSAAILVFAPMLFPVAMHLNIDPVHLGIIFVLNLAIGMFTPPFGMNIFVAQSVLKKSTGAIAKACIPFVFLYILAIIMVSYIPQISLLLPTVLS